MFVQPRFGLQTVVEVESFCDRISTELNWTARMKGCDTGGGNASCNVKGMKRPIILISFYLKVQFVSISQHADLAD